MSVSEGLLQLNRASTSIMEGIRELHEEIDAKEAETSRLMELLGACEYFLDKLVEYRLGRYENTYAEAQGLLLRLQIARGGGGCGVHH